MLLICLATTLIRPAQTAAAATNSTVNFQARLESNTGAVVSDGNYNVEFKLYSASSGGSALWTEDYLNSATQGLTVVNGYLTANLGSLTSFPGTINWDQQLWVTMNIGGTTGGAPSWDGEMNPRLQLTSVPYAFRAGQLALLTGSNTSTLGWATQTTANSLLLPNEGGTLCVQTSANCGFAPGTTASYIQNGTSPQTASFNITGSGTIGTNLTFNSGSGATITGPASGLTVTVGSGPLTLSTTTSGTLAVTSAGALSLTGAANSTWDIGNNTLSLQTTGNGAITTGTGLLTVGGSLTFSGTSARTITGPTTGGLTVNDTGGALTLSTTTSGTLSVTSAGILTLTGAANSTWDLGSGHTLSLQTTNNGPITTGTGLLTVGGNLSFGQAATVGEVTPGTANAAGFALSVQAGTANGSSTGNVGGLLTLSGGNAAGSAANNGGNVLLQGGTKTTTGTPGSVIVKPQASNDSTTAFLVQNAASANLLQVDTTGNNVTLLGNNSPQLQTFAPAAPNALPAVRAYHGTVVANGYIYVIGGDDGSNPTKTIFYAPLSASGAPGTWSCEGTNTAACGGSLAPINNNTLPAAREDVSAVAANGYLYVIDGSATTGNDATKAVYYARLNADGSTGAWTNQASNLTNVSRTEIGLVTANGYIYAVAGNNGSGTSGGYATTEYAKLNADGSTGAWTTSGNNLPTVRYSAGTIVANGYIYVVEGFYQGSASHTIMFAPITSTGDIGAWSCQGSGTVGECNTSPAPANANSVSAAQNDLGVGVANGYIYAIGGQSGGTNQSFIYYAQLNSNGTTGTWTTATTTIPTTSGTGRAAFGNGQVIANGYFYIAGGTSSLGLRSTVYYTSVPRIQVGGALDLVGIGGETLTSGAAGGELVAGSTSIVGTLSVRDTANFSQSVSINGPFTDNNTALIQPATNSAIALQVENASGVPIATVDTSGNQLILGTASSQSVNLAFATAGGGTLTVQPTSTASNFTLTLPAETGTICTSSATGVCSTAGTGFILNKSSSPGTAQTGNFNITGTGIANTLQAATIDSPSGTTTLAIGTTNATTAINLNQNTQITGNLSFATGANRTVNVATQATSNTAGNTLTVQSATGNGTGAGGALTVQGGSSGATSGAGGLVTIQGGNAAGSGAGAGGGVSILGGTATTTGAASVITITAGNGVSGQNTAGGAINITSGTGGGTQAGGLITLQGGVGGATGAGGGVTLQGGASGGGNTTGGVVTLQAGAGAGTGTGAAINLTAANGGGGNAVGGAINLTAGNGTASTTGGTGGIITLQGGNAAGSGVNNGGAIYLIGGTATSTGTAGNINLAVTSGNVARGRVNIGTNSQAAQIATDSPVGSSLVVANTLEVWNSTVGGTAQILFTNTGGTNGFFRMGSGSGDLYWQGGGGQDLQLGAYWPTVITGDRGTTTLPSFVAGATGTAVNIESTATGDAVLQIRGVSSSQTGNLLNVQKNSGAAQVFTITSAGALTSQVNTDSATALRILRQGGNAILTADTTTGSAGNGVLTVGSATSDANQTLLQLDSFSTFADTATCATTTNQGAMYYNSNASSSAVRTCVNGNWEDLVSTSGLGLLLFGVVPDSANAGTNGDLGGISGYANSPCMVTKTGANQVTVQPCVAYSGGRKSIIASTNLTPSLAANAYQNICINASGVPAFVASANTTETSAGVPAFSANNPILCLATVKGGGSASTIANIYDIRSFTTTEKTFATINSVNSPGWAIINSGATSFVTTGTANTTVTSGVVIATTGTASTTVINAIIATSGPQFVKATGTNTPGQAFNTSTTTGYGTGGNTTTAGTVYGRILRGIDTTCTSTASGDCEFSAYIRLGLN